MVLGISSWHESRAIRIRLIFPCDIDLQDPSQLNLVVNGAVLVKVIILDVFCGVLHLTMGQR